MDPAYIEILDTNKELRKELEDEIAENKLKDKKLKTFTRELENYYRILSHQDSTILAHEDEIASLKSEIKSLKQHLYKALQDLRYKSNASTSQDIHILRLEDKVDQLKKRMKNLTDKKFQIEKTNISSMSLNDLLSRISTALDQIENHIGGTGPPINPANVLNGVRITITTIREHFQSAQQAVRRITVDRDRFQGLLNIANRRIKHLNLQGERTEEMYTKALEDERKARRKNHLIAIYRQAHIGELVGDKFALQMIHRRYIRQLNHYRAENRLLEYNRDRLYDRYLKWKAKEFNSRQIIFNLQNNPLVNMNLGDVHKLIDPQFASLPYYDGQEEPDSYYAKLRTINESARPLAVAGFNAGARANKMKGKMTGRFHPVPANNPYNGNNPITDEAEFLNWLQGKYREVMVGTNQDALRALMTEKFSTMDTADTYEKRIKPYAQGLVYADVLPYLYGHMPQYMEMRLRQTAPANLDAFFTNLRTIWLETRGRNIEQTPSNQAVAIQPQKDSSAEGFKAIAFMKRFAGDLQYTGLSTDIDTLGHFIYSDLDVRLGRKTSSHVRKLP